MVSVVLRAVKGTNLTPAEGDSNIDNLNKGKREILESVVETSVALTMEAYKTYIISANVNLTLPPPSAGIWLFVMNASGVDTPQIIRNGSELIMGLSEDLVLDIQMKLIKIVYVNTLKGWVCV